MKLTIKNISSIKSTMDDTIKIRNVYVSPDMYKVVFYNQHYWNNWEVSIHRDKENIEDSYDVELADITNTNHWERYTLSVNQIPNIESFFKRLNEMCHDFDVINNK